MLISHKKAHKVHVVEKFNETLCGIRNPDGWDGLSLYSLSHISPEIERLVYKGSYEINPERLTDDIRAAMCKKCAKNATHLDAEIEVAVEDFIEEQQIAIHKQVLQYMHDKLDAVQNALERTEYMKPILEMLDKTGVVYAIKLWDAPVWMPRHVANYLGVDEKVNYPFIDRIIVEIDGNSYMIEPFIER